MMPELLVYEALSYRCFPPYATCVFGLKLLVHEALSYHCSRPSATSACGLKLLVRYRMRFGVVYVALMY